MIARQKWTKETDPLEIGDVVLIAHPQETRSSWPRGVIEAVHPGPDGRIRVVTVKTIRGSYRRPVNMLIRLVKGVEVQRS